MVVIQNVLLHGKILAAYGIFKSDPSGYRGLKFGFCICTYPILKLKTKPFDATYYCTHI